MAKEYTKPISIVVFFGAEEELTTEGVVKLIEHDDKTLTLIKFDGNMVRVSGWKMYWED